MSSYDFPVFGTVFGGPGTFTSGIALSARSSDNSVEREKYTSTGTASGSLEWQYTRKISGIHTSVSNVQAVDTVNPARATSERKIFFTDRDRNRSSGFDDWTIFDNAGVAVGATTGVTDLDISPAATFDGDGDEPSV